MKISVIVAVKNAKKTIERCINSVLAQNNKSTELIIIDGKSTDGTLEVIKKYEEQIAILISEKDNGVYDAMNKGIFHASGDVFAFLNSDDWYCENVLERVEEIFEGNGSVQMVYGDVLSENKAVTSKSIAYDNFMHTLLTFNICHQCVFARKEVFENIGIFDTEYRLAAEYDWMLRLALSNMNIFHDNNFYAHYTTGGMSEQQTSEHGEEAWTSSKKWIQDEELLKIAEKTHKKNIAKAFWNNVLSSSNTEELNVIKEYLERKDFDFNIVIYGAGEYGSELKNVLDLISIEVQAFIDRDYQEIETIEGIPVISFESYIRDYKNHKVIISPVRYEDIEKMFHVRGLMENKDYLILVKFLMDLC